MRKALSITIARLKKQRAGKFLRDNPFLDRLIEVGTKALRRELMSGETLRAPRQQLRRLHASAFDLSAKLPAIARLYGARCILGLSRNWLTEPATPALLPRFLIIRKSVQLIRKNSTMLCCLDDRGYSCAAFYFSRESLVA
ncbi:MAG: hypothetical protein QOF62_2258 [Pyrinomonadaceae bacterium]|jgi:hypothetical protein|nr:hypothetical protein [Pyrinomonadaceae bacterium]